MSAITTELREVVFGRYLYDDGEPYKVAYLILDKDVYFTAINNNMTIQLAEAVITAICDQESISWKEYSFYDFQTNTGFRYIPYYWGLDRLILNEGTARPQVAWWHTVAMSKYEITSKAECCESVPQAVWKAFHRFIDWDRFIR